MKKLNLLLLVITIMIVSACNERSRALPIIPITKHIYVFTELRNDTVISVMYVRAIDRFDADRIYNEMYYGPLGLEDKYSVSEITIINDSIN